MIIKATSYNRQPQKTGIQLTQWLQQRTSGISRNVLILLSTEPLWSIPVSWTRIYASLFMSALGLTATQIGWIISLTLMTQMLVAPLGGYVADRFGRKRILMIFDTLAWAIPMILWMTAQNVWYFVLAAVLNGLGGIIGPAWNCLLVEDTSPHRRSTVFGTFQLIVLGAGLFAPIAGWIVSGYSVIFGTRVIYAIAWLSITTMISIRGFTVNETSIGQSITQELRGTKAKDILMGYREILSHSSRNRTIRILFLLTTINFCYTTIWNTYSTLYMTHPQGLNLSVGVVSAWPTFSSAVMIVTLLTLVPKIKLATLTHWLVASSTLLCLGMVVLVGASPETYAVIGLAAVLIAVGTALINPVRDTFIANVVQDRARAMLIAGMNSLSMIIAMPLSPWAGRLFEINPKLPLVVLLIMLICSIWLSVSLYRVSKDSETSTTN